LELVDDTIDTICTILVHVALCSFTELIRFFVFFFHDTATTEIYTLSLHDALPIYADDALLEHVQNFGVVVDEQYQGLHSATSPRSEEHTSELQSPYDLVCRLLLEKKKKPKSTIRKQTCFPYTHLGVPSIEPHSNSH